MVAGGGNTRLHITATDATDVTENGRGRSDSLLSFKFQGQLQVPSFQTT